LLAPPPERVDVEAGPTDAVTLGEAAADPAVLVVRAALEAMATAVADAETELGRLDSIAGDGDHGAGMGRGMRAAAAAASSTGPDTPTVLQAAGIAFGDAAGGASGALWGSGLLAAARALRGAPTLDTPAVASAVEAALDAVVRLGGAARGDKTLVDALAPFLDSLRDAGDAPLAGAWRAAASAATDGARATAALPGRKGRAATHGDHSIGTPDPGATSLALAFTAASDAIERGCGGALR
jgi:dihydroxyacetone kinase